MTISQNKVLIARFEHQCTMPLAYPDYFQNKPFTDSLLKITSQWAKNNFKAASVDYKRRNPITYMPGIMEYSSVRSIANTDFDMAISIVSTLFTENEIRKIPKNSAQLQMQIEVTDRNERRLYRNKIKVDVVIGEVSGFYNETKISETDFQTLYFETLQATLGLKPKAKGYAFQQPTDQALVNFIELADRLNYQVLNRGAFEWQEAIGTRQVALKLSTPFYAKAENRYERGASFINPYTQKEYQLNAMLTGKLADRVTLHFYQQEVVTAILKSNESREEFQISGKIDDYKVNLTRNLKTNLVKIYFNEDLKALLVYQRGKPDYDAQYDLYLSRQASVELRSEIAGLLLGEMLIQAVRKYYELESQYPSKKREDN
ncbi:MAG: hypothetical protein MUE85_17115 [Microscillaceae bacterium]|nr:hypothetical protein [Microscillaceae bacterium]